MGTLAGQYLVRPTGLRGDVYIETGLSEGTSMAVALGYKEPPFKELHGIEVDAEMVAKSSERFKDEKRLKIHHGSSLDILPSILDPTKRTVFWLDAHYDGAKQTSFDPRHGQCVLLGELDIIASVKWAMWPTILIDDASTFCSDVWWVKGAHGKGMIKQQNPTFQQIYDVLGGVENFYDFLIRDQCICCFPRRPHGVL